MNILGLDIGGANLKAAAADGQAASRSFEIWKAPERLTDELQLLTADFPQPDIIAVTMTAELADCFATKAEGVAHVIRAVVDWAGEIPVYVWRTAGGFAEAAAAIDEPQRVAAANWHALATWVADQFEIENGLLIDIGSTTTDLIPLAGRKSAAIGLTDPQRLQSSELIYTGIRRTPLCALAVSVPYRGGYCPLAAEWFATTQDVYLTLGDIAPGEDHCETADGRPATVDMSRARLGRMLCCDSEEFSDDDARIAAQYIADVQLQILATAVRRLSKRQEHPFETLVLSGSGSFLAQRLSRASPELCNSQLISLAAECTPAVADAACAFAVAKLAEKRFSSSETPN